MDLFEFKDDIANLRMFQMSKCQVNYGISYIIYFVIRSCISLLKQLQKSKSIL